MKEEELQVDLASVLLSKPGLESDLGILIEVKLKFVFQFTLKLEVDKLHGWSSEGDIEIPWKEILLW